MAEISSTDCQFGWPVRGEFASKLQI